MYRPKYVVDCQHLASDAIDGVEVRCGVPDGARLFRAIYEREPSRDEADDMNGVARYALRNCKLNATQRVLLISEFGIGVGNLGDNLNIDTKKIFSGSYNRNCEILNEALNILKRLA